MPKIEDAVRRRTLAILVGGGPAPGINGVIRSITIEAVNSGLRVLGIYDGFKWLARGDSSRTTMLDIDEVSRIQFLGGSILRTSRENPTGNPQKMEAAVRALTQLEVDYLVTIGGDDTAYSSHRIAELLGEQIQIAHVPKTIDNDLPLPGDMPTFGYETARHVGAGIVHTLMEDAQTTNRWYCVVSMGRKAGHLALGIGKAAGATLTIIGEEFRDRRISFTTICDILESSAIKRMAMNRPYGVAVLAEGILDRIDKNELMQVADLDYDAHGNIRFSEIDLGRMVKNEVTRRLKERGIATTLVAKDIGYELRCAAPIPFDREYVQDLGYAAVRYLLNGGSGAIVAINRGKVIPLSFTELADEKTGRLRIRQVDIDSDSYKVARQYMVRLEAEDFAEVKTTARLALIGKLSKEEFEHRFKYLINDPPVKPNGESPAP
ncbi:MAG: diphosphate--fructose-6-phosphate 1-phosphotransferase [bacterium]|nr:diphosphate--fructose-6-phosphate 1-phosphotransferase [bacterium]